MNAREVLNRYAKGERDFRRANLRGQSFQAQDLSGADFSEADIRGTNFSNAILREVNFTAAKAGIQRRWTVGQLVIILMLAILSGMLSGYAGIFTAYFLLNPKYTAALGIPTLIFLVILFVVIIRHGFIVETFGTLAITLAITFTLVFALAFSFSGIAAGAFALVVISAILGVAIVAFSSAFAGSMFDKVVLPIASIFTLALALAVTFATKQAFINLASKALALAILISITLLLLGSSMALCALRSDRKYHLVRKFSVVFNAISGTRYYNADLTGANFTKATLKSANFREATLKNIYWKDTQKLDRARLGNSILANPAVRELLVTRDGSGKSYVDAKLRAANLDGVNLEGADLTWADLSCATLRRANLKDATLTESLVLDTDFTAATLTGACLEAWNMDSHTNLEAVDCQYVYLLRHQQERRPSSGDFAPGEFTKLFQEVLSTVDLIFRNGIDWKAFTYSFNQLVLDNAGTELSIQSIENKGDGVVVVRVNAPPDADKAQLHSEFNQTYERAVQALEAKYHAQLQAKEEQITIYRQQSADMLEITRLMANRPISIHNQNQLMNNSSDQSENFNVGGDFSINATNSVVNLRDISGTVTNAIQQLPADSDPTQPNLKDLLTQLQAAIEAEPILPDGDKADLLEQVQHLAEAKQTEEPAKKEGLARKAKKMFDATLNGLPDTAKLAEACSKLLPLILKVLGVPV